MRIILASTSKYRKSVLEKLHLPFECIAPTTIENQIDDEDASAMSLRLAIAKAKSVAYQFPDALVIGSDQVACLGEEKLGKPGDFSTAQSQLQKSSAKTVTFYTGLCVYHHASQTCHSTVEPYSVTFRPLSSQQIDNYLNKEQPFDCAGSFKSEGLGIAMFQSQSGRDPNSLIGLPLIALCDLLALHNLDVLAN